MRKSLFFFLGCVFAIITSVQGRNIPISKDSMIFHAVKRPSAKSTYVFSDSLNKMPPGFHKKHRLVAALLAFPLGVFGLHRMYLHTSPLVPVVYIATFGGLFGVLPFIDFVLILLNKDIHLTYTSNPHLFMWQKR